MPPIDTEQAVANAARNARMAYATVQVLVRRLEPVIAKMMEDKAQMRKAMVKRVENFEKARKMKKDIGMEGKVDTFKGLVVPR